MRSLGLLPLAALSGLLARAYATERVVPTLPDYPDIQTAINASVDGDVITVTRSSTHYAGMGFVDLEINGLAITIRGRVALMCATALEQWTRKDEVLQFM